MNAQPGIVRLTWRSGLCLSGLFFVLLGGIFAAVGGKKLALELLYKRDGIRARGTILSKSVERASGRKSSTSYLVTYRFATVQSAAVVAKDEVDADRWEELQNGASFEIIYLPRSPETNRAADKTEMPLAIGFTGVGAFAALVGGVVIFAGIRGVARHLRIWRTGVTAEATVLKRYVSGSDRCLQYRYHDLQGNEHTYTVSSIAAEEYAGWQAGDKGHIRFDPEDPGRSVWVGRLHSPT